MPQTPLIRDATPDDAAAIAAIYRHYVLTHTATFETDPPDAAEMTARMQRITQSGMPYLVAEDESSIVGYSYATTYRPRAAYRHTIEDSVYVAPGRTGGGIGYALLERLLALAGDRGYREVIAIIGDSANAPSIKLHDRAGFVHVGTLRNVGFKFDRWLDTVVMQKSLGSGE